MFGFCILDKNHELFSNKNEKVIGKFKTKTTQIIWISEFFVYDQRLIHLNVEMVLKRIYKVFQKLT